MVRLRLLGDHMTAHVIQSTMENSCLGKHACQQHSGLVPHLVAKLHCLEGLHYQDPELANGTTDPANFQQSQTHQRNMVQSQFIADSSPYHNTRWMLCYLFKEIQILFSPHINISRPCTKIYYTFMKAHTAMGRCTHLLLRVPTS
jgi:hypothetical protein